MQRPVWDKAQQHRARDIPKGEWLSWLADFQLPFASTLANTSLKARCTFILIMALGGRKAHETALNISLELFLPTHHLQHHLLHCILSQIIQHQHCQSSRGIWTTLSDTWWDFRSTPVMGQELDLDGPYGLFQFRIVHDSF